ncbi:winged helix-turn-helix domain-containing protein [Paenibacillus flagellatus]|uniref:ArsR family transcriptional regulator n=1 Tax=Paenibacillus flagellatus TaxID=2211139 RepID=A0A2V5K7H0_9BACL|nr:helix-turn-helix domain-containing protein [Paenibacillus flagellatus]PYI53944.1 ArsR family transcriptional regulator [Paenibacillus flagellatus]
MSLQEPAETYVVTDPEQAVVLLNPLRAAILSHMREPVSAAEVGRAMGETPQRINYHLKALDKAGLVRRTGTRQVRNLVEVLYQAIAKTFVLSDTLGFEPETVRRMKEDGSLSHLVQTSDKLKRDALRLLERSEAGETVHSASLAATVKLAGERERQSFVQEYMEAVRLLTEKYGGAKSGDEERPASYQLLVAVYPQIGEE